MTPLVEAPALAARYGAGRLWLKLECAHPTGVHKHRSAAAIVKSARSAGRAGVAIGTCGNAGRALAPACRDAGLALVACVPQRYAGDGVAAWIESFGAEVLRPPGGYEEAVECARGIARERGLYDANPAGAGGVDSLTAYGEIAREIVAALGAMPDSVWVPVGNGTTYAGIGAGFQELAGSWAGPPRMGAAGSAGNTAAVRGIAQDELVRLDPGALVESPENEPLLNWHSAHDDLALAVARATRGLAEELTDAELLAAAQALREAGHPTHPSGAAGVAGLARALEAGRLEPGVHVAILTASAL